MKPSAHTEGPPSAERPGAPGGEPSRADDDAAHALQDAERRATEAQGHYHDLASMLPALISETDAEGRLVFVNRYGLELTGYGEDEWRGLSLIDVVAPVDRARVMENFARRMAGAELPPSTYHVLHRDGVTLIPIELRAANIVSQGRVVGTRCVLFDLRDRVAAERERLHYEQRTLEARRLESLGVLAGGVAHDFNNLLAVVLGNADLALLELPPESSALAHVRDIWVAAQRAAALTKQLLAYAGKAPFHRTSVDANALVHSALAQLPGGADDPRVDLQLSAELPPVHGDRSHLAQVIQNLVANALEALPPGRGSVTVETRRVDVSATAQPPGLQDPDQLPPGPYIRCCVRDDGIGMDARTVARMFEPFFTTKFTGRGLGLSVVVGVMRSHGGGIAVRSQPGRGTCVDVYLPVASTRAERREAAPEDRLAPLCGRALVVDHVPEVAGIVARLLGRLGLETETARDAAQATRAVETQRFDVVLAASRGGGEGAQVVRAVSASAPDLPVVLYSADSEHAVRERLGDVRVAGYLDKPFDLHLTHVTLRAVLDR